MKPSIYYILILLIIQACIWTCCNEFTRAEYKIRENIYRKYYNLEKDLKVITDSGDKNIKRIKL